MWDVETTDVFDRWFDEQTESLKEGHARRYDYFVRVWPPIRAFFAFDPSRHGIVLCAGDKTGLNEKKFYKDMIKFADAEYRKHLNK